MFVYHRVPKELEGEVLYPLNQLKTILPDLYAWHREKYQGREHILQNRIPTLGCLWNDVLFFSTVHPRDIRIAREEAGYAPVAPTLYYQVDAQLLDPARTSVWLHENDPINIAEYREYCPEELHRYSQVSSATREYYRTEREKGQRGFLFIHIPHVLYLGTLTVSNITKIDDS